MVVSLEKGNLKFRIRNAMAGIKRERNQLMANNTETLRNKVYDYLRGEMDKGSLLPGALINLNEMSERLQVSKTPLREALLRLEAEGFVSIRPRSGVIINRLELEDIRYLYEVVAAIEAALIDSIFDKFDNSHVALMERLNVEMREDIKSGDYVAYDKPHWDFHNLFTELSGNVFAKRIIIPIRQRLWDFPRRRHHQEWELMACDEHQQITEAIKAGNRDEALRVVRQVHWNFAYNEEFIRWVYFASA
jgi:DNA-binding GntR family transcriptional regulator